MRTIPLLLLLIAATPAIADDSLDERQRAEELEQLRSSSVLATARDGAKGPAVTGRAARATPAEENLKQRQSALELEQLRSSSVRNPNPFLPTLSPARRAELRKQMDGWRATKIESGPMIDGFQRSLDFKLPPRWRTDLDKIAADMEGKHEVRLEELKKIVREENALGMNARLAALDDIFKLRMAYFFGSMLVEMLNDTVDTDDDSLRQPKISKGEYKVLSDELFPASGFTPAQFEVSTKP